MADIDVEMAKMTAGLMALARASGHLGAVQAAMDSAGRKPTERPHDAESASVERPVDHDALVARAEELGIKVDKRWGDDRLAEEIAATDTE